jgi:GTPase SAR1 family protein
MGTVNLVIWDTAGQEKYRAMSQFYYRNADIACICIDLSEDLFRDEQSKLADWQNIVASQEPNCLFVAIGTKTDLLTDVERDKIEQLSVLAAGCGIKMCLATSAENGDGTDGMLDDIARFGEKEILCARTSFPFPILVPASHRGPKCCN